MKKPYLFIDLFAGIGGFLLAFHKLKKKYNNKCVFVSEIDEHARQTYEKIFQGQIRKLSDTKEKGFFVGDIVPFSSKNTNKIPPHDILCAGFPCQPFSQAGYKRGFQEAKENRGNMFFEILVSYKRKSQEPSSWKM